MQAIECKSRLDLMHPPGTARPSDKVPYQILDGFSAVQVWCQQIKSRRAPAPRRGSEIIAQGKARRSVAQAGRRPGLAPRDPPRPPFSRVLFFRGLKPGKNKTREKGGIHIGLLAQGGAPLALGYYHVVPTGLVFGSLLSHKGQTDNVQLSSRPQLSGRTRNPAPGEQLKLPSDDQLYKEAVGAVRKAKTNSKVELPLG